MPEAVVEKKKVGIGLLRAMFEQRVSAMKSEGQRYWPTYKDIKLYEAPTRGFFDDQPNDGKAIDHKTLLDEHPQYCSRTLGSGISSGMTSQVRPWFKLGVSDQDLMDNQNVKLWLDTVEERMRNVFQRSNIYGALTSFFEELGSFGTAAMYIGEDFDSVVRARNFTAGEYFLSVGPDGRVNGFAREFWMTVDQLVKEFGKDNVSDTVKKSYESKRAAELGQWIKVIHLIEENDDRVPDKADFQNMKYRSIQWESGSPADTFLRIGGYNDFPVLTAVWGVTTSADIYGKGAPGWLALGASKGLQKLQKDRYLALDLQLKPPLQKDANVSGEVNTAPGGITTSSSNLPDAGVRPAYQVQISLADVDKSIENTRASVSRAFYTDLFLMLLQSDRRQVTAEEIAKKYEEKLMMLGPVLDVIEDFLDLLISRTFLIMLALGMIPEIPEELQGQDIKIDFISVLSQAQKAIGTQAIQELCQFVGELRKVFPESGPEDKIDIDEIIETFSEMKGVPARLVRSAEIVAAMRKAKQEALLKQQQMQSGMQAAEGAKTLSQAKVGEGTALDAVIKALTGKDVPQKVQEGKK